MQVNLQTPEGRRAWRDYLAADLTRLWDELQAAAEAAEVNAVSWAYVAGLESEKDDCQEALANIEREMTALGETA